MTLYLAYLHTYKCIKVKCIGDYIKATVKRINKYLNIYVKRKSKMKIKNEK